MKIEIRNVKYAAFNSEETPCFECTIWIDGKPAGSAHNAGHGGPTDIDPRELEEKLDAYGASLPRLISKDLKDPESESGFFEMKQDGETLIGDLLEEWLAARDLKRLLGRELVYLKGGEIWTAKPPKGRDFKLHLSIVKQKPIEEVLSHFEAEKILNLLPFDEALKIYKESAS